ncbi:MAG TPA: DinB family protein [Bryobacteraceae bacterium]|nr:DinB family protein [Bryobacteraceae bacterium]
MRVSADVLRMHLDYTAWASRRLVDIASRLSADELKRDFQTADHSVLGTLVHVFGADRIWLGRVTGAASGPFLTDADYSLAVLQNDWPALHEKWRQWAAGLTDASAEQVISYKDTQGNAFQRPLWQLILHVVNHGTHHRGQVSGFLRAMGQTPPPLDLTAYYREQAAHA